MAEAKSVGCMDCPETDPIVLEFHHRNPDEKLFTIGRATGTESVPKLLAEIEKCDVVCANCHRRREHVGRSSMVESLLVKESVAGSTPVVQP